MTFLLPPDIKGLICFSSDYYFFLFLLLLLDRYFIHKIILVSILTGSSYCIWEKNVSGVLLGSISGPLLFNMFLCHLFKDIIEEIFTWFSQNEIKANLGKCYMLLSTIELINFQVSETVVHNSQSKNLLRVTFDKKLKFEKHINTICQIDNRKLITLLIIAPYIELTKGAL